MQPKHGLHTVPCTHYGPDLKQRNVSCASDALYQAPILTLQMLGQAEARCLWTPGHASPAMIPVRPLRVPKRPALAAAELGVTDCTRAPELTLNALAT